MNRKSVQTRRAEAASWLRHAALASRDMIAQIRGKKILDARRRRAARLVLMGILLTMLALALDTAGLLRGMENWYYDQRTYWFQFNTPPPSQRIVHLDIDDGAINVDALGRWPWSRKLQARLLDELNRYNPRLVFLDIVQDQPQKPERDEENPAPTTGPSPADTAYAEMLRKSARTLLPISVNLDARPAPTPIETGMVTALMSNLAMPAEELGQKLIASGLDRAAVERSLRSSFAAARDRAADALILGELQRNPDTTLADLRARYFPKLSRSVRSTPALNVLSTRLEIVRQEQRMLAFSRPIPRGLPELIRPNYTIAPITLFSQYAAFSGFVDHVREREGESTVRSVPLFINLDGRMFPHVSLQIACAFFGIKLEDIQILPDRVIIPAGPDHPERVLFVRTMRLPNGRDVPFVLDVPWFGGRQWLTMYDVPNHIEARQHLSVLSLWNVLDAQEKIRGNVESLRLAVSIGAGYFDPAVSESVKGLPIDPPEEAMAQLLSLWNDLVVPERDKLAAKPNPTADEREILGELAKLPEIISKAVSEKNNLVEDIRRQREELRPQVEGKIILVGLTATGGVDQWSTPLHGQAPGIIAHGALINGILTGHLWGRAPVYYTHILTVFFGFLTTFLVALNSPTKSAIGAAATISTYIVLNGFLLFDAYDTVVGVAGPMTAMGIVWAGVTLVRFILEIIERNRITSRFSNYVDPQVVDYIVQNPDQAAFSGASREMTVVFTDLEGFTTLSERLGPSVVKILNEYVALMTPIIRSHHGVIDKFLGDGIMFEFNAVVPNPEHAKDALLSVLEMQQAMLPFNDDLRQKNLPTLRMRVGVNTGDMIVGDAGGGGAANFTVLGDNVNLAARLESANKAFGSLMLMTDATFEATGGEANSPFAVRPIAKLVVKGKEKAVMTYEPLCHRKDLTPELESLIRHTREVFDRFVAADFERCMAACDRLDKTHGPSKFSALYHKNSVTLLAEGTGPDFDGTVTLSEK